MPTRATPASDVPVVARRTVPFVVEPERETTLPVEERAVPVVTALRLETGRDALFEFRVVVRDAVLADRTTAERAVEG